MDLPTSLGNCSSLEKVRVCRCCQDGGYEVLHGGSFFKWLFLLTPEMATLLKQHPVFVAGAPFPKTARPFPLHWGTPHPSSFLGVTRPPYLGHSHDYVTTRVKL